MTQHPQGVIVNYSIRPKNQKSKEYIIQFFHLNSVSDAYRLIGRKIVWKSNKSKIIGKIVQVHGRKGLVRARFRRGLPGQALGTTVELTG
ncbi:MAG: 50S ribosomal protein L35ae [Candidatus Bathyarchaeia archaeon]